ncbi:MAG: LacI family transcriptional regulator [Bacteroidetes bacterium GWF2_42_66]|nr:MAG: LacI family transcriptional regulator [Bacteroidetes bacterium GWA2_42_15]OFX96491.1 MAG: LacI family transcriptional regulator [Bacteroidetes bacterium GWE2_42_39]OFY40911.1 MAG: LacI family transcriptional regulator [Bacteroidetes bacterium GWF2_42_66]HBL76343.1 LacI family transcriptional regulator [Prolixibacteraceae bacterium]HCR92103.1 LacI family transcriptional regulator [Prolixibacteraceae bacterium]
MRSSQVTIKDIARELGISASTVSRALKNHPDISEETRRAVNELADRLSYQPNAVALSLKHSRSNTIGVIIPEIVHYFFSSVISGIEDVAYEAGFTVIICQSNEMYDREVSNARALRANRVDGVLVSVSKETFSFNHLKYLQGGNIPLVFFDRIVPEIQADCVIIDDKDAAYRATMHMIDAGRRRIAHFAAPQNLIIGRDRKEGYLDALREANIPIDPKLIIEADSFEKARIAMNDLIDSKKPPDGIFAVNDLTAIGAMQTIQKRGYKIPNDISVVGFSDGRFSGITEPNLTSVDQHGYEMGTIAAEMLIDRIMNKEVDAAPRTKILQANLIVRGSSMVE